MPLAFPSSHSKCLTCRLTILFHRSFHSSESCTKGSLAWTTSGLWSLEVGASSCVILFSTGCCKTSLTAFVLANSKGNISLSYFLSCHYTPPILGSRGLDLSNLNILSCFFNGLGSVSSIILRAST